MPWYAVHTKSRHEYKAHNGLTQKQLTSFLPEIEVWSKRKDRKKRITVPLFPGYLFVQADLTNEIKLAILKTFGVVRILGKKKYGTLPVPDAKIQAFRGSSRTKAESSRCVSKRRRTRQIIDGPFTGIEGIVVKSDPEKSCLSLPSNCCSVRGHPTGGFQVCNLKRSSLFCSFVYKN